MWSGVLKKVAIFGCAGAILFSVTGCKTVTAKKDNGFLILKEMGEIYTLHKASFEVETGATVGLNFKSICGYELQEIESATKGYVVNEKKGVIFSEREYSLYTSMDAINPNLLQKTEYCEDCFAE